MAYSIDKKVVRHDDASEEVDGVNHQHTSSNYSKFGLYNRWISTKETVLNLKQQLNAISVVLKKSTNDVACYKCKLELLDLTEKKLQKLAQTLY